MSGFTLGEVTLSHGVCLAPMAGVTDGVFRALCRRAGAEYTVSEMISAKALCYEQKGRAGAVARTAPLARLTNAEMPAAVQLFGAEPDLMAEAARRLAAGEYRGAGGVLPVAIDINMGCPVPKVVKNGEGSALLLSPDLAARIVRAVKDAVSLPVTVKMRAGFDEKRGAADFAAQMEDAGADMLVVHGRTRTQFYAPGSDNAVIAAVKARVQIPVVGNGDLFTLDDVIRMRAETGCDGVMIARGALGNPFFFSEIAAFDENRPFTPPTVREKLQTALDHARALTGEKGARVGLSEARKHMLWYCKGLYGAAKAKNRLVRAESVEEIRAVFEMLLEENE